jgi:hypothetical protein
VLGSGGGHGKERNGAPSASNRWARGEGWEKENGGRGVRGSAPRGGKNGGGVRRGWHHAEEGGGEGPWLGHATRRRTTWGGGGFQPARHAASGGGGQSGVCRMSRGAGSMRGPAGEKKRSGPSLDKQ